MHIISYCCSEYLYNIFQPFSNAYAYRSERVICFCLRWLFNRNHCSAALLASSPECSQSFQLVNIMQVFWVPTWTLGLFTHFRLRLSGKRSSLPEVKSLYTCNPPSVSWFVWYLHIQPMFLDIIHGYINSWVSFPHGCTTGGLMGSCF